MTAIQRFAIHDTIMNPHSHGPYVRHEDHLAAMQGRCLAQIEEPAGAAPAAVAPQAVVAWMHPETLNVISAAHKHDMSTEYGAETRRKAESYSVALVRAGEPAAAAPALEAPAAPCIIDIGEGGQLRMDPDIHGAWQLFRGGSHIRYLDKFERNFVNSAIRAALAGTPHAAPVAGQSRFAGETTWGSCTVEHVGMVLAGPRNWDNYEVRYLYAAPQAPAAPVVGDDVIKAAAIAAGAAKFYPDAQSKKPWTEDAFLVTGGFLQRFAGEISTTLKAPARPAVDASDTALLDAMELHRIAVVPEHEGPWDAELYEEGEEPQHVGSGATPREALRAAIAAQAKEGGAAA